MTRRQFGSLLTATPLAAQATRRPNIVLITADHLRWNHVAANGNPAIQTPHLDSVAREGVSFTLCTTVGVACAPNRASLFTGRYPNAHRLMTNGIPMPESEVTITHVLRDAGYYTGQMGKLHFQPHSGRNHREYHPPYGFHQMRLSDEPGCYDDAFGLWLDAQGPDVRRKARVKMPGERGPFDYYTFEGDERTTHAYWVATETSRFIRENRQRPYFVHAGFYAPHPPLNPPAAMLALYRDTKLPPRHWRSDEADHLPPNMRQAVTRLAATPEDTWTAYRRHFYAMVSELDRNIGRILAAVDPANTIVVVTSDHGDYLGDHNLNGKSAMPYDGAMRIPLLMRGPGIPAGAHSDEPVEILDVTPTLLDLIGLQPPKGNQGLSLVPVMKGGKGKDATLQQATNNRILRTKAAKYCVWQNGEEVLFDLARDPHELRNVAGEVGSRALLDEMRVRLLRRVIDTADPLPERIAPY
jgi:arylsulfatase